MTHGLTTPPAAANGGTSSIPPPYFPRPSRFSWRTVLLMLLAAAPLGQRVQAWAQRRIVSSHLDVAHEFAVVARQLSGVREVWLHETEPILQVTVLLDAGDLERELEMRRIFDALLADRLDPMLGEL